MEVLYQLSYAGRPAVVRGPCRGVRPIYAVYYLERETGFEPATLSLEG